MAGNYPDAPSPRMYYDRDGTIFFRINNDNTVTQLTSGNALTMNNEDNDVVTTQSGGGGIQNYYGLIFPEPRDINGYYACGYGTLDPWGTDTFQSSTNTTNGLDGTWNLVGGTGTISVPDQNVRPYYRDSIVSISLTNVLAVRFRMRKLSGAASGNFNVRAWHLYGRIASGTPDRIRFWHPTLDEPLDDLTSADASHLDWGNVPRSTTQDRTFRLKNNSATLTANDVDLVTEIPTDTTPTLGGQFTYSDGGAFASSLNFTSLAPGALTPVITVRRTTPSNATLSVWTARININVDNWS